MSGVRCRHIRQGTLRAAVRRRGDRISRHYLEPEALKACGASVDDVRRRLHAVDRGWRLAVGADVVVAVWRATPGEAWLASLFRGTRRHWLTRFVYDRFGRSAVGLEQARRGDGDQPVARRREAGNLDSAVF